MGEYNAFHILTNKFVKSNLMTCFLVRFFITNMGHPLGLFVLESILKLLAFKAVFGLLRMVIAHPKISTYIKIKNHKVPDT
jgi:hypothetical protein